MIKTIIVDDEPACRDGMLYLLKKRNDLDVAAVCRNGAEAIEAVRRYQPHLMMLDIQMPEVSGFDVAAALEPEERPRIIFVTAYDQYALDAFRVHALDYLLKPYSEERLNQAVDRAAAELETRAVSDGLADLLASMTSRSETRFASRLMVEDGDGMVFVDLGEVVWIEGCDYYARIHLDNGRAPMIRQSLKSLENLLDPGHFARIHKSAIVNIKQVEKITGTLAGGEAVLRNGVRLPVSRRRKKALLDSNAFRFGI